MAEQFLRIGGTDGSKARALRTDEKGNLVTGGNNVLITSILNFEVEGKGFRSRRMQNIDLSAYEEVYFSVRSDIFHDFRLQFQFGTNETNTFGRVLSQVKLAIDANNKQIATSGPIDIIGDTITHLYIDNFSTNNHNYDIFIFGKKSSSGKKNRRELESRKYSGKASGTRRFTRASGPNEVNQVGVFVESGSIRVQTNGEEATSATGIPLGYGHYMYFDTDSVSVYYEQDSVITVVYRQ